MSRSEPGTSLERLRQDKASSGTPGCAGSQPVTHSWNQGALAEDARTHRRRYLSSAGPLRSQRNTPEFKCRTPTRIRVQKHEGTPLGRIGTVSLLSAQTARMQLIAYSSG